MRGMMEVDFQTTPGHGSASPSTATGNLPTHFERHAPDLLLGIFPFTASSDNSG
jgi:hypothetical protein